MSFSPKHIVAVWMAALTVLSNVPVAQATHQAGSKWRNYPVNGYNNYVWWRFDDSFPGGDYRNRVSDGRNSWNKARSHLYYSWDQSGAGQQANGIVRWIDITFPFPDNTLGSAFINGCSVPADRHCTGTINIDKYSPWYLGTGTPPSSQYDLWSLAVHEWGHLNSMSHEQSNSSYVMYNVLPPATKKRCPSTHERDTLRSMYGYIAAWSTCYN